MSVEVPTVFISHISEEGELAGVLKKHLAADFGGRVRVFVSSDLEDITAGRDWLKSVRDALDVAGVELILCSRLSVSQPWVNFELGAAWLKGIPIVPICHSGFHASDLPMPYSILQAVEVDQEREVRKLYSGIAAAVGTDTPEADFARIAADVRVFESTYAVETRMRGQAGTLVDLRQGERLVGRWEGEGGDLEVPGHVEYKKKLSYKLTLDLRRRQSAICGEFSIDVYESGRKDTAFIELINISGDYFYFKYWLAIPQASHCGFMVMQLSTLGDELEGAFLTNKIMERQIGFGKILFRRQGA